MLEARVRKGWAGLDTAQAAMSDLRMTHNTLHATL